MSITAAQLKDIITVASAGGEVNEAQLAELRVLADQLTAAEAVAAGQQVAAVATTVVVTAVDVTATVGLRTSQFLAGMFSGLRR